MFFSAIWNAFIQTLWSHAKIKIEPQIDINFIIFAFAEFVTLIFIFTILFCTMKVSYEEILRTTWDNFIVFNLLRSLFQLFYNSYLSK